MDRKRKERNKGQREGEKGREEKEVNDGRKGEGKKRKGEGMKGMFSWLHQGHCPASLVLLVVKTSPRMFKHSQH